MSTDAEHEYKIDPRLREHAEIGFVAAEADRSGCACWLDPETGRPRATPPDEAARSDQFAQVFIEVANQAAMDWVKAQPRVTHFVNVVDGYCTATVGLDRLAISRRILASSRSKSRVSASRRSTSWSRACTVGTACPRRTHAA